MAGKTPHIVLGVTGSIAAYKAVELVRLMVKRSWTVSVVMTRAAAEFVTPLTFQTVSRQAVGTGLFDEKDGWHPEHIAYADRADVFVVAPCTANVIAKLAHGLADDLLSCTALATRAPVVIAPAMNVKMWEHPATQANVATLKARGAMLVGPAAGDLACGYEGAGRMAEPETILTAVDQVVQSGLPRKDARK
jgi:phosphopantothenoylcysteine decarboxylase/phosphopantothenate--cysteine ligase